MKIMYIYKVKKLFLLLYIILGTYTLFQISKLLSTIIEKNLSEYVTDTKIENFENKNPFELNNLSYDSSISLIPLFSIPGSPPREVKGEDSPLVESPLLKKYELKGVILLPDEKSLALIRKTGEAKSNIYHKGDILENAEIIKIERHRILLNDGFSTIVIPMYYKYIKESTTPAKAATQEVSSSERLSTQQVKKVLSRSDVENKVFKRVNQILSQIAVSPYMVDGNMEGISLMRIPKNSIVYELGGRNGDIIRRVNGHEVNQIDQMYKLWDNIKDDSFISVDIERNRQIFTYEFEIRE